MVTRKQHYYPRSLLKNFGDDNSTVFVYIRQANKIAKLSYENICFKRDAYESGGIIDNILENKLSTIEAKACGIIKNILQNWANENFKISQDDEEMIFKYMILQQLRTDTGRINFISRITTPSVYIPRTRPIEIDEIQENKTKIELFNYMFKQPNRFEQLISGINQPDTMKFHIAISENNLLTSDNPIIGIDNWKQIILPIHPNICLEFQDKGVNRSQNLIVKLTDDKVKYLNQATINTASYYIISNKEFSLEENNYIYNRFNNPNWKFQSPHFND